MSTNNYNRCQGLLDAAISVLENNDEVESVSNKKICRSTASSTPRQPEIEAPISEKFIFAGQHRNNNRHDTLTLNQSNLHSKITEGNGYGISSGDHNTRHQIASHGASSIASNKTEKVAYENLVFHANQPLINFQNIQQIGSAQFDESRNVSKKFLNPAQGLLSVETLLRQALNQREKVRKNNEDLTYKLNMLISSNQELEYRNKEMENNINNLRDQLQARGNRTIDSAVSKNEEKWNRRFNELKEYKEKNGDCLVPQRYKDNPKLGIWVATQRNAFETYRLTKKRVDKLSSIGFVWDASTKRSRKIA